MSGIAPCWEHAGEERPLPPGYAAVAIDPSEKGGPARLCVLVRQEADPAGGHLVLLRDTADASVYLGCVTDAGGRLQRWLELWVQNAAGLGRSAAAARESLTNQSLDQRWESQLEALDGLCVGRPWHTGWERRRPAPTWIDPAKARAVCAADASGRRLTLCTDDQRLKAASLPAYSTSLARYLVPEDASENLFVPVADDAARNEHTRRLEDASPSVAKLVAFNPGGGFLTARPFDPLSFDACVDTLTSGTPAPLMHGRTVLELDRVTTMLAGDPGLHPRGEGYLFRGPGGRSARAAEVLFLKLRLLAEAFAAVRRLTRATQRPMLGLSSDSFRVRLDEPGVGFPFLWTARALLAEPGDSFAVPIASGTHQYFLPADQDHPIYRPTTSAHSLRSRGQVRLRKVQSAAGQGLVAEGTMATEERIEPAAHDLIWLRLNLDGTRIDLPAELDARAALASSEWRFTSLPQVLPPAAVARLRSAEGVPLPRTPFDLVPLLSTPYDLYSLCVLGARTLLVNRETTLPIAMDDLLALAREVAAEHDDAVGLPLRVQSVLDRDPRFLASLGPQRLIDPTDDGAAEAVPPEMAVPLDLWCEVLALLVGMLPGLGPDSRCGDLGDAPPNGVHQVFDRALVEADALLTRVRSLVLVDWTFNREVNRLIRRLAAGAETAAGALVGRS